MPISFSIIVPTYHRSTKIEKFLKQFVQIEYPTKNLEVIIVNNDPDDLETKKAVSKISKKISYIKYVAEPELGASPARNKGVQTAKYQHLIFLDDDMKVSPLFLNGYNEAWSKYPDAKIVAGKIVTTIPQSSKLTSEQHRLLKKYPWCFGQTPYGDQDAELWVGALVYSGNMSYRIDSNQKEVFHKKLGVYCYGIGRIGAEDYELCTRTMLNKHKVMYISDDRTAATQTLLKNNFTKEHVAKRHFMSGLELAAQKSCLKEEFPLYGFFYPGRLMNWRGLATLIFDKYERIMLLSYIINRHLFRSI